MFPKLIMAALVLAFSAVMQRRRKVLPFAAVLLLTSVFFSRIYWRTGAFTLRFESIACLLVFLAYAYDLWRNKIRPALDAKTVLVLALFPAMVLPSALVSPSPLFSLKKTLIYVPYLLAFLALNHFLRKKGALAAAWEHFYEAGVLALGISTVGLVLFMAGVDWGMIRMAIGTLWLRGTFVIPNILGSTTVLILIAGLVGLIFSRTGARLLLVSGLVLASVCLLTSMTLAAWLCAAVGAAGVFAYGFFTARRAKAVLGLAVVGLAVALTYVVTLNVPARLGPIPPGRSLGEFGEPSLDPYWKPTPVYNRFNYWTKTQPVVIRRDMGVDAGSGEKGRDRSRGTIYIMPAHMSLTNRETTAREVLNDWRSSPIIGRGTESYAIIRNHAPLSYISSTWITMLHDWGLIGLGLHLAFLALVFFGLVRAFRRASDPGEKQRAFAFLLVLALSTIMYQFATTIQVSIFWVLLAFYVAASSPLPEERGPAASGNPAARGA